MQAFYNQGSLFPAEIIAEDAFPFHINTMHPDIQNSITSITFDENSLASYSASFRNTVYKSGEYVLCEEDPKGLVVGKICLFLLPTYNNLYVVVETYLTEHDSSLGTFFLGRKMSTKCYAMLNILLDYHPLQEYLKAGQFYFVFRHSYLSS